MHKRVKINYPKKKSRININNFGDVTEPERCSVYQTLLNNLKMYGRATFLHRIIYVGTHRFSAFDECRAVFCSIVTKCNEGYCIEKLTGFLLFYKNYFVHMIEGDEDSINKHIGILLDENSAHYSLLGKIKLLIHVSNINQRFLEDWVSVTGAPAKLLEKLDVNVDFQQSGRHVYNCIKKFYMLMNAYIYESNPSGDIEEKKVETTSIASEEVHPAIIRASYSHLSATSSITCDTVREYKMFLPEYELLDFIINSDFTMPLKDYHEIYNVVPMRDIYKDKVWPVPHDFIPYDIFEKPYDCPTELPKGFRKQHGQHVEKASLGGVGTGSMNDLDKLKDEEEGDSRRPTDTTITSVLDSSDHPQELEEYI